MAEQAKIGHNNGPTMVGSGWRKHCWSKARTELMPRLPIEIIRRRIVRAKELGLDYKSYASIRATSGHDVVAFLFSSNALRALKAGRGMPLDRVAKIAALERCGRLVAVQKPLTTENMRDIGEISGIELDTLVCAPDLRHNWHKSREMLLAALKPAKIPKDRVVTIGETMLEQDWCAIAGLGGSISAEKFFAKEVM